MQLQNNIAVKIIWKIVKHVAVVAKDHVVWKTMCNFSLSQKIKKTSVWLEIVTLGYFNDLTGIRWTEVLTKTSVIPDNKLWNMIRTIEIYFHLWT